MKTLIIHHLEPEWERDYKDNGLSFEALCRKVAAFIKWQNRKDAFERVILTKWAGGGLDSPEYYVLQGLVDEVYEYGYGWDVYDAVQPPEDVQQAGQPKVTGFYTCVREGLDERGYIIDDEKRVWPKGGTHSEIILIEEWMQELPKENVFICGAFDGECIEDLEYALDFLEVKYERIEDLII